jgi:F0F1-type ATP synthase membrane subunit b/b'
MSERAKRELSIETDSAVRELHTKAANLAIKVASQIIRKQLDGKEHERLIRDSLGDLEKVAV